jgi:hypothetical protein
MGVSGEPDEIVSGDVIDFEQVNSRARKVREFFEVPP